MSVNNKLDEIIDFKQFFFKIIKNWYFFVLSLILTFVIAFAYNRYTHELYRVETSILISEDNAVENPSDLLYEKAMQTQHVSLENTELILKSYPLVSSTLMALKFDVMYEIVGNIKISETYIAPVKVECEDVALVKGKSITINCIDEKQFILIDKASEKHEIYNFGEEINFYKAKIKVQFNFNDLTSLEKIPETIIIFRDIKALTREYQQNILITQKDKESTVINISILTKDQFKGIAFLNKLTEKLMLSKKK